jgi:Flp pilus assembly protein TadD
MTSILGRPPWLRRPALAAVLLAALALGGCLKRGDGDITGSIARSTVGMTEAEKRTALEQLARQYEARQGDKSTSMTYARLLRDTGQTPQAIAVMQTAAVSNPNDKDIALALGQALADGGRFAEAQEVLQRAHTPDKPNWRVLSSQGAIADQLGQHKVAQDYYQAALRIAPGEPVILSNLGLSYALSNELTQAETIMRQAVAHPQATPRMRGNLALVLALQGRYQDAEQAAQKDLSPAEAAANITFVRSMTAQNNSWRQLQSQERRRAQKAAPAPRT